MAHKPVECTLGPEEYILALEELGSMAHKPVECTLRQEEYTLMPVGCMVELRTQNSPQVVVGWCSKRPHILKLVVCTLGLVARCTLAQLEYTQGQTGCTQAPVEYREAHHSLALEGCIPEQKEYRQAPAEYKPADDRRLEEHRLKEHRQADDR